MSLRDVLRRRIRAQGPLRFAEYMECALYHPELGYYASASQRSGRAGDFITSVDIGPLFGRLLAAQLAQMWELARDDGAARDGAIQVVEAAAGNGRLARDVLDAARETYPAFYDAIRLTLVERSAAARASHGATLGPHAAKLDASTAHLPTGISGIVYANELLDALPVHAVVMTDSGLREVFIDVSPDDEARLVERLGPPGRAVEAHVRRFGIRLPSGARAEVSPAVVRWVETAARCLERGFLLLIDYGHEARELYSSTHAAGTIAVYRRHVARAGGDALGAPPWLDDPGTADITAHVDLTAVRTTAEAEGLTSLATVDQSYFLLGLGAAEAPEPTDPVAALKRRLALKSLLVPGGLGSTHKVLIFGRRVGTPALRGCSFARRAT